MNEHSKNRDDLLEHYKIHIDLYKHYLKLAIEVNVFYYAVTGAIISYYFVNKDISSIRFALLLPIAMSLLLAVLFIFGIFANQNSKSDIQRLGAELNLVVVPEFAVLDGLLGIFAILMLIIAAGLFALFTGCIQVK